MKLEVKNIFPATFSGTNVCIYQLPEVPGMREILAHGTRMQNNPEVRTEIFCIFKDFQSYAGPKSNLHLCTEISAMVLLTLKFSIKITLKVV